MADLLYPVSLREGGELVVFIDPELPFPLLGDGERLRQVLFNLLGNAIKFSSQQAGRLSQVRLEVELVETDGVACKLLLAVTDNGIGISDADQERLFLPFEQAKETGDTRFGGTGLGLSICRQLVQLMGGEIEVFSAVGVGATGSGSASLSRAPLTPPLSHVRRTALAGQEVAIWALSSLGRDLRRYLTYYGAT